MFVRRFVVVHMMASNSTLHDSLVNSADAQRTGRGEIKPAGKLLLVSLRRKKIAWANGIRRIGTFEPMGERDHNYPWLSLTIYLSPFCSRHSRDTITRARQARTKGAAKTPRARTLSSEEGTRRVSPEGEAPRPLTSRSRTRLPQRAGFVRSLCRIDIGKFAFPLVLKVDRARVGTLPPSRASCVRPRRVVLSRQAGLVAGPVEMRSRWFRITFKANR